MESTGIDKNTLGNMLSAIGESFKKERAQKEPYKELFGKGSTHTGLLRELETQMMGPVLDACDVYEKRHGVKINKEQFHVLLALPLLVKLAEKQVHQQEGLACCVDKAYYILSEQLLALSNT